MQPAAHHSAFILSFSHIQRDRLSNKIHGAYIQVPKKYIELLEILDILSILQFSPNDVRNAPPIWTLHSILKNEHSVSERSCKTSADPLEQINNERTIMRSLCFWAR